MMPWGGWADAAKDLVFLGGCSVIVYGMWQMYEPVGYVVAGAALVGMSWFGFPRGA